MFTIFFSVLILLVDSLLAITLWVAYRQNTSKRRQILRGHLFASISLLLAVLIYRYVLDSPSLSLATRQTMALLMVWIYLTKVLVTLIFGTAWTLKKIYHTTTKQAPKEQASSANMTRAQFLERSTIATSGITLGLGFWGTSAFLYDYQVRHIHLKLPNLPTAFDGIRIGQISDIHAGSLTNRLAVKGGFETLLKEKPDLICFTGDLVNYETQEVRDFEYIFSMLKAPMGVFSCLGNHDYGDYRGWASARAKQENLEAIIAAHQKFGWKLLIDAHTYIQEGTEKIALLGVGNWGKFSRFPKYGNLSKAHQGIAEEAKTKILLSHDPTHWDAQIRPQTPDIALTLAGHTHGMQMGIEWGKLRLSPAQLLFEQWAGLYQKDTQYLYVNRGFGYSDAFPIRLGMYPEITIFTLHKA